jgi:methionine--tRNA ligase beta chain
MDLINYDHFAKLETKIGTITAAEKVEGSDKLMKLTVDLGEETRTIVSGIAAWYSSEDLVGRQVPILVNLEPRKLKGVESQGMMLCADKEGAAILLQPITSVPNGSPIL